MTHAEWQAEVDRLQGEIETVDTAWTGLRALGDWPGARAHQDRFHELRAVLATHVAREPGVAGGPLDEADQTIEQWRTEGEWISHEIDSVDIEWRALRASGDWEAARGAQDRFHLLRGEQTAHTGRKPANKD